AKANAPARGWSTKISCIQCSVNCVTVEKEDGVRHWNAVILYRLPHFVHANRSEAPSRGPVFCSTSRDRPCEEFRSVLRHDHKLIIQDDPNLQLGTCLRCQATQQACQPKYTKHSYSPS